MKRTRKNKTRSFPGCGRNEGQMKNGKNRSGTQTYICRFCNKAYTPEPKRHAYYEASKKIALRMYYSGVSGRGVGKVLGMNKANVYNWIKKTENTVDKTFTTLEMDKMHRHLLDDNGEP